MQIKKEWIILLFILAIASFFRLWQLDSIPPGLYPDEAINGNEAMSEPGKIFYPENNGREGLYINLIFLSFKIFGPSPFSLRLVSAIIGILTVLGLYLLTGELFQDSRKLALLSSFFLAISFWHTNFSRIGFRGILVPFILVFTFYFLFKGLRTKRTSNFIISGIFFGLGFYTYTPFRLAVLLFLIALILWWFVYRSQALEKKFLLFTAYSLLFAVIVALPLGIYFFKNPQDFISRATKVSIFAQTHPIKALARSLIGHLAMFNFYGDSNWRHNFSGSPQLLWPVGILFLIGIGISILKKERGSFAVHCFLLSWFFLMLLPGILTSEGIPHSLRTIGTIPAVYLFAALGGWFVYQWFLQKIKSKKLLISVSIIFLLILGLVQFDRYFFRWAKREEVRDAFSENYVKIGEYLNHLPSGVQKYVIVNQPGVPVPYPSGLPMPAQTPMFIERTKNKGQNTTYLLSENIDKIQIQNRGAIFLMRYDRDLIDKLSQRFPQGRVQEKEGISIYKIP